MPKLIHPLLTLIAQATEKDLVLYIEYLKAENRILRGKLPKRITVTPAERAKLVKLGVRLGSAIKELITIVHPRTFSRWVSENKSGKKPRRRGRPRKPEEIRELIVEMAKSTGWGYRRIIGELKKLGIRSISRSTVARILQEHGFDPGPTHIIRDRDTKFTDQFCSILETDGIEFRPIPARSPNLNPYCESWVGRTRQEVLNHFIVFGEKHLRLLLKEWLTHYHTARPHQGLGNVPISGSLPPPEPIESVRLEDIVCHEALGGLLKHYERKAA